MANTRTRARGVAGSDRRRAITRLVVLGLLMALIVPLLMMVFAPSASAEEEEEERDNYSLYNLASNASTYFSEKNSPDEGGGLNERWDGITKSPATGGSMLGYADPEFSMGDIVGWFFAEVSGSSQTVSYDTFKEIGGDDDGGKYAGMVDYAHFGATNQDLGLDSMSASVMGKIINTVGGSIMWALYALSLFVSLLFYAFIQLLKLLNPFMWFYQAVKGVADASGSTQSQHQKELADGMVGGDPPGDDNVLAGLQNWISDWYGLLQAISWQVLVPLFIAFLLIGLVLFKKMDRGSAIKKLLVRVAFIGLGLPLLGSMYTGVLDKFDDSLLGQHAGPTRVILSTYVDFEAWMMNDRLGIPDDATIGWDNGQASSEAMMSVRTSALAINKQSHGDTFADIGIGSKADSAEQAWSDGLVGMDNTEADDTSAVFGVFKILGTYITSQEIAASDFESGIKTAITKLDVDSDEKKGWFVEDTTYGDPEGFGEEDGPEPNDHPVISTLDHKGLTSSKPGGDDTDFTTTGTKSGCGFQVMDGDALASCNLSALSAYNYLNTGFGAESLTMYSSNNATSGFTRENHMVVSQVGTGPAKFMYWHNAATILGCMVLLGFWYAFGMLFGAIKRTFSLVAAIPFATLGAIAAISKVIVYSVALVLEVLVTVFLYQFVSELLISLPDIVAGPLSHLMTEDGLFGSATLGGVAVVVMTLISSILILVVTVSLIRVRKVVLQAMDEAFTKLVNKFLETNTVPKPGKGGLMPALAGGLGSGAGMAAGQKLASGLGGGSGGGAPKPPNGSKPGMKSQPTNAGGTNGPKGLQSGPGALALEGGKPDELENGDDPNALPSSGKGGRALPPGGTPDENDGDKGGPLQLSSGKAGSSRTDKEAAQDLNNQGGLSNLGYNNSDVITMEKGSDGVFRAAPTGSGSGGSAGSRGRSVGAQGGQTQFGLGGGPAPGAMGQGVQKALPGSTSGRGLSTSQPRAAIQAPASDSTVAQTGSAGQRPTNSHAPQQSQVPATPVKPSKIQPQPVSGDTRGVQHVPRGSGSTSTPAPQTPTDPSPGQNPVNSKPPKSLKPRKNPKE